MKTGCGPMRRDDQKNPAGTTNKADREKQWDKLAVEEINIRAFELIRNSSIQKTDLRSPASKFSHSVNYTLRHLSILQAMQGREQWTARRTCKYDRPEVSGS